MPFGNGTGPQGMGAMTGRALGYCAGFPNPGFATGPGGWAGRGFGRGFGSGGGGRGWRNRYWATGVPGWAAVQGAAPVAAQAATTENEAEMLKRQAEALNQSLEQINKRLEALEKETE